MSVKRIKGSGLANSVLTSTVDSPEYARNPAWLPLPSLAPTDQKLVGLYAIQTESNFCAFVCAGNYTVDWGDGVTENFASGVTAYHLYAYADVDLAGTNAPVTFIDVGDLVHRVGHGYVNGSTIRFYGIVSTTGLVATQLYFVINATPDYFQVASSLGGTPLTLTTNGSAALLSHKQALITVTPQATYSLTSINLNVKHTSSTYIYTTGWLDIAVASPVLDTLVVSAATQLVSHSQLFSFSLVSSVVTSFNKLFFKCHSLTIIPVLDTSSGVNFTGLFDTCYSLTSIPSLDTSKGTDFSSMFNACFSITKIPVFDTSLGLSFYSTFSQCCTLTNPPFLNTEKGTTFSFMFNGCRALTEVPLYDTSSGLNFSYMFSNCAALGSVPVFNTALGTDFSSMFSACGAMKVGPTLNLESALTVTNMFNGCYSLTVVPPLNTATATDFAGIFGTCSALTTVPNLNTSSATTVSYMFNGCSSLLYIPLFDTSHVTDFSYMFTGCKALKSVPALNTALATTFAGMFNGCSALEALPAFNVALVTTFNSMLPTTYNLSSSALSGAKVAIDYSYCKLSAAALNAIFTNLGTVTSKTITITGNWGASTCTRTIATAKGWTVTG